MALTINGSDPTGDLGDLLDAKLNISGGKILQVVSATDNTATSTTSTSYVTTGLSATITPTSATSKVLILVQMWASNSSNTHEAVFTVFRGTVAGTNLGQASNGLHALWSLGGAIYGVFNAVHLDSPATTSSQEYTAAFRVVNSSSTSQTSGGSAVASMILMEVSA
jgi:hypothetical protein